MIIIMLTKSLSITTQLINMRYIEHNYKKKISILKDIIIHLTFSECAQNC